MAARSPHVVPLDEPDFGIQVSADRQSLEYADPEGNMLNLTALRSLSSACPDE
jgi:hypothetical protein